MQAKKCKTRVILVYKNTCVSAVVEVNVAAPSVVEQ